MSDDKNLEDIHNAEQIQESEELVDETQVESNEEVLEEKAKDEGVEIEVDGDEDEDEEEMEESSDEESDEEEPAPKMEMPKTKAGIVNAAYDMLKKAKKEDAQKIFAGMMKFAEGVEVVEGEEVVAEAVEANVSHIDYQEDLDVIVAEEATLSEGFREKAGIIFESALKSKVGAEVERLENEYAQNLEEEVSSLKSDLVEKVDAYLSYVVEGWMKENEVAVETGLRAEIAEDFMASLQSVFKEHYIEIPEGKVDMFDELADQVAELEEQLNKTTEDNIAIHESLQSYVRKDIVRSQSSELATTEAEKLASLVEDLDFTDASSFEMKVKTIKESYFAKDSVETVSEESDLIGSDHAPLESHSDSMARYMQAIAKSNK